MPYWRLSLVYFFYFGIVGAMSPFWALYLQHLGFSPFYIGIIAAIPYVVKLVMPSFWGYVADSSSRFTAVIQIGCVGTAIGFLGVTLSNQVLTLVLSLLVYSFFWNAILSQVDSVTLHHLGDRSEKYSQVRLWGSIGFVCLVFALGLLFDSLSISHLPKVMLGLAVCLFLVSFSLHDRSVPKVNKSERKNAKLMSVLGAPDVLLFFSVCFLLQVSLGTYYVFYSIYLESTGYNRIEIGSFWVLGVIAEIVMFVYMHRVFSRVSMYSLMLVSLVLTACRWVGTALLVDYWLVMTLLQLLHAFTFAVAHAVGVEFVRKRFGKAMSARGQAMFNTVNYGAGAMVGATLSGSLWGISNTLAFLASACVVGLGAILFAIVFRRQALWRGAGSL